MKIANSLPLASRPAEQQAQLGKAAQQFEAIFVRQMLAAAHKAKLADGLFDNSAVEQFQSMQDSRLADIVSENGGLGLARTIEQQLSRQIGGNAP
ncbi:rod-binding protein [Sphingomonas colocasiae]|uniref:Rod-binding protein n=1 Tax=Sphingomonas colocasiae TaxID=1848973 RepID=A0ABS7PSZ1_9SPHN|nr:rod-binding protein [Sphingomonas colocasiae]MBY8824455.1 rod-binding protein [Sphingomonas colocasiae]